MIARCTLAWVACALGLMLPATAAAASPATPKVEIQDWTLKNGMHVIFAPHRRVPAVTVQVWYHAGSKDERIGIRGIAHLFEHMMFKGSEHVPPEEHARLLSAIGGSSNAFTAEDMTAYHDTVPAQYLDFAMRLEAERMRNLHLTLSTIKSEREVVKEEKRMRMENNPIGRALEAIYALSYKKHPYAWTPAGNMRDLDRISRADCQRFYDTYYVPRNATLVVVGDVSRQQVARAAERHFGAIAAGKEPPRVTVREPTQTEPRVLKADWPSQLKVVLGAYHVPEARHADIPALQVLSAILSAGKSSRLNQALVRKGKLAVAAGGFVSVQEQPGLLMVYGVGLPSHDLARIKNELLLQLQRVTRHGVTAAELNKARNQLATMRLSKISTLTGLANEIGQSALLEGDPRAFLKQVAAIDAVTSADIRRVARTYLAPNTLNLVLVDSRPGEAGGAP